MAGEELRDHDVARAYVLQGLWLQSAARPSADTVHGTLEYALEIAAGGHLLLPVGFLADAGTLVFGPAGDRAAKDRVEVPGWPHPLARSYEDHVLGKLDTDGAFERAADSLRQYSGRDRVKGLAYVARQIRERSHLGGVELPPAALRSMRSVPAGDLLAAGYESLSRDGPMPLLVRQYEELVRAARRWADVLGPEDVIALEQRTALADMGQYVAHRQILQVTARLEARLPARPVRPLAGRREVPTRVADEDNYPVGGYSSVSTRGSMESLLHSQLAYMEQEKPDLFDVKFARDELFYYSRDENQFLRRRRTFVIALFPDLAAARFKDPDLPAQRVVLVLSVVLALARRLADWLSTDALRFEVVFVRSGGDAPLAHEAELMELLLREPIARGSAAVGWADGPAGLAAFCAAQARSSQLHVLTVSTNPVGFDVGEAVVTRLTVNAARPTLTDGHGSIAELPAEEAFDSWAEVLTRILALWV